MQWEMLLELFASRLAWIMRPLNYARFIFFDVTASDLGLLILSTRLLLDSPCILIAIQVVTRMVGTYRAQAYRLRPCLPKPSAGSLLIQTSSSNTPLTFRRGNFSPFESKM